MTANYLWFEVKTKRDTIIDNGKVKSYTETYLVDAVTFTDAETAINRHLKIDPGFIVTHARTKNLTEVIPPRPTRILGLNAGYSLQSLTLRRARKRKHAPTTWYKVRTQKRPQRPSMSS
jgi:hypothetical protein